MRVLKDVTIFTTIFIFTALLVSSASYGACTIELMKKKVNAKTLYTLKGESISIKVMAKLKPQCNFKVRTMTLSELHAFKVKRLKNQLYKLNNGFKL